MSARKRSRLVEVGRARRRRGSGGPRAATPAGTVDGRSSSASGSASPPTATSGTPAARHAARRSSNASSHARRRRAAARRPRRRRRATGVRVDAVGVQPPHARPSRRAGPRRPSAAPAARCRRSSRNRITPPAASLGGRVARLVLVGGAQRAVLAHERRCRCGTTGSSCARSHAKRSPTRTTPPASRTSGRAAAKNAVGAVARSHRGAPTSVGPAKALNDAAHDAATLPHSSAAPTRQAAWARVDHRGEVALDQRRVERRRRRPATAMVVAGARRTAFGRPRPEGDRRRRRIDVDHRVGHAPTSRWRRWRSGTRSPGRTATSPRRRGRCRAPPSCRPRRRRGARRRRRAVAAAATRRRSAPIVTRR